MSESKPYNKFIHRPSNSNALINVGLIIGFVVLIAAQLLLFRVMSQDQTRTNAADRDGSGKSVADDNLIQASSAIQLVACADLGDAVALARPAVVNIDVVFSDGNVTGRRGGPAMNFDMPPSQSLEKNEETIGSGIIVDSRGYVITCHHMVRDYPKVYVTILGANRKRYPADLVESDVENDLALLKISPGSPVPAAQLGNSDMVKITSLVLAIGSPFGFEHTVTRGIVSDNKRSLLIEGRVYKDLLQVDAAINRGSAGGALINGDGEVIGVNIAIVSGSDHFSGMGFAVPSNRIRPLLAKTMGD